MKICENQRELKNIKNNQPKMYEDLKKKNESAGH